MVRVGFWGGQGREGVGGLTSVGASVAEDCRIKCSFRRVPLAQISCLCSFGGTLEFFPDSPQC